MTEHRVNIARKERILKREYLTEPGIQSYITDLGWEALFRREVPEFVLAVLL